MADAAPHVHVLTRGTPLLKRLHLEGSSMQPELRYLTVRGSYTSSVYVSTISNPITISYADFRCNAEIISVSSSIYLTGVNDNHDIIPVYYRTAQHLFCMSVGPDVHITGSHSPFDHCNVTSPAYEQLIGDTYDLNVNGVVDANEFVRVVEDLLGCCGVHCPVSSDCSPLRDAVFGVVSRMALPVFVQALVAYGDYALVPRCSQYVQLTAEESYFGQGAYAELVRASVPWNNPLGTCVEGREVITGVDPFLPVGVRHRRNNATTGGGGVDLGSGAASNSSALSASVSFDDEDVPLHGNSGNCTGIYLSSERGEIRWQRPCPRSANCSGDSTDVLYVRERFSRTGIHLTPVDLESLQQIGLK